MSLVDFFHVPMPGNTPQKKIDHVVIEGVVHLLFQVLKDVPEPWTITRVNDFFEVGRARSWKDEN